MKIDPESSPADELDVSDAEFCHSFVHGVGAARVSRNDDFGEIIRFRETITNDFNVGDREGHIAREHTPSKLHLFGGGAAGGGEKESGDYSGGDDGSCFQSDPP